MLRQWCCWSCSSFVVCPCALCDWWPRFVFDCWIKILQNARQYLSTTHCHNIEDFNVVTFGGTSSCLCFWDTVAWVVTHSLPSRVVVNFLWSTAAQGTLPNRYICSMASSTGLAGPQRVYLKMTTLAQRDRFCKPAFPGQWHAEGHEANGIIDIKVPVHRSLCLDVRSYHYLSNEDVLSLLPAHTNEIYYQNCLWL
jgi:hypothetical protein